MTSSPTYHWPAAVSSWEGTGQGTRHTDGIGPDAASLEPHVCHQRGMQDYWEA